jgi:LysM repeat protein
MRAVRQAASGLVYGLVSLLLVIGSLSLALAQGGAQSEQIPTLTPLPSSTSTPRPSPIATEANTATATSDATDSATPAASTSTRSPETATAAPSLATTAKTTCGAPYGWVRSYVVQPGDTLFRIAMLHAVSVDALQRANCRTNTTIYVGERLWVPFARPVETELTIIPTFPTPTEPATATDSVEPSATEVTPVS